MRLGAAFFVQFFRTKCRERKNHTMNQILITRVKVASELMKRGYTPTVVKNPYAPCRTAWEFEYCPTLMYSIRDIYKQIGAELPQSYRDILDRIDGVRK